MPLKRAERNGNRYVNPVLTAVGGLSLFFKVVPRFLFDSASRSPQEALGPFPTDPGIYRTRPTSGLRVTWFGHSSSLIEIDGARILIDPVWDERAAPTTWAGPKRFFPPTLALEDLPPVDAVVVSHDHYDHLGAGTVRKLASMRSFRETLWVTPLGVGAILKNLRVASDRLVELDWTEKVEVGGVTITALPTRHFSGRGMFNRFQTLWASFALVGAKHRVYYGADSGEWEGFKEIGSMFGPFDLTMLEIGAFDALWADIHMGPEGAVRTFKALGGHGLFMPIHWGLFDLALHPWQQPIEAVSAVDGLKMWSPPPGLPADVESRREIRSQWWR